LEKRKDEAEKKERNSCELFNNDLIWWSGNFLVGMVTAVAELRTFSKMRETERNRPQLTDTAAASQ